MLIEDEWEKFAQAFDLDLQASAEQQKAMKLAFIAGNQSILTLLTEKVPDWELLEEVETLLTQVSDEVLDQFMQMAKEMGISPELSVVPH